MYDTTAFNFTMMFGLEAITVDEKISNNLETWTSTSPQSDINADSIIWATDGEDDRSVAFAARKWKTIFKFVLLIRNQSIRS